MGLLDVKNNKWAANVKALIWSFGSDGFVSLILARFLPANSAEEGKISF